MLHTGRDEPFFACAAHIHERRTGRARVEVIRKEHTRPDKDAIFEGQTIQEHVSILYGNIIPYNSA
jgi:hypothetical protein